MLVTILRAYLQMKVMVMSFPCVCNGGSCIFSTCMLKKYDHVIMDEYVELACCGDNESATYTLNVASMNYMQSEFPCSETVSPYIYREREREPSGLQLLRRYYST